MADNPESTTQNAPPEPNKHPEPPIAEKEKNPVQPAAAAAEDPAPKNDHRKNDDDNNNGLAKVAVKNVISGEGSEPQNGVSNHNRSDAAPSGNMTPSGSKKVHWNPELTTESPRRVERSNPYVSGAPVAANSPLSLNGKYLNSFCRM